MSSMAKPGEGKTVVRRVVVSGLGIVSPLGNNPEAFFSNLMAGRSGISRFQPEFAAGLSVRCAAQATIDPSAYFTKQKLVVLDRFSQFALVAASQAMTDAHMRIDETNNSRVGVSFGTGVGGVATIEEGYRELFERDPVRVKPATVLMAMNNAAASQISIDHGLKGPNLTYSTACSSSALAIGEAYRMIRHGYADVMLAGGSEALLTYGTIKAWEALRALAVEDDEDPSASCKPFSKNRSGLVLGEGAAVLILEEAGMAASRGAKIYGEIIGYGCSSDASHLTKPSTEGQSRTICTALEDAGISPAEIDYINAHGTATPVGDQVETAAIKQVFGEAAYSIPISSTKSMHGHMMGATGAVEFIVSLLAIAHCSVPPTAHLKIPDPQCDLDYVPEKGRFGLDIRTVMSNSFAFGGTNAVLIARAFK